MKTTLKLIVACCAAVLVAPELSAKEGNISAIAQTHVANSPANRNGTGWWKQRHAQKVKAAQTAKCDILFIGDSITHMWESRSGKLWQEKYVKRNAFNIGYSGDQTQHVLWRLENGELTNFKPKVAVLMIGTNNTGHQPDWTAQKVADGVQAIIHRVHANCPETKVLLLGIFPRGATPDDKLRVKNDAINKLISAFDNGDSVHYLDLAPKLLEQNGNLSRKVMPDLLHPNAHGYKLWHDAMEPLLKKLLKESKAPGAKYNSAVVPVPKLENDFYDWQQRHEGVKKLAAEQKNTELIFIGDSITHMFGGAPKSRIARGVPTWEKYYGQRKVINMGFGWDRTQNMLWRLQNGALDGISPKVAVVLAGTNNLTGTKNAPTNTPEEIVAGVKAICDTIHQKSPKTQVVVLSVLPRKGFEEQVKEINKQLPNLVRQEKITYVNLWEKFVTADGKFDAQYFHDTVHPNASGYQLWAETLEPTLQQLLSK